MGDTTNNRIKQGIKISYRNIIISAYLYMIMPIIIFFIGWMKVYFSIPGSLLLIIGMYWLLKSDYCDDNSYVELSPLALLLLISAICLWIYLTGIGGYMYQRWDWHGRNAVLRDLIEYSWPVIYPETDHALVYYFIYWMVPAIVGKVFGWGAANFALYIWSVLGVFICYLLLVHVLSKYLKTSKMNSTQLLCVFLVFVGWGGLNIIGAAIANMIGTNHVTLGGMYGWTDGIGGFQYTPNTGLLEWVFNQAIVPWIATLVYLQKRKISTFAFLGLCALPFAPLPFVGIFLIMISDACFIALNYVKKKQYKALLKEIFSIPNLCAIGSIFIVFLLFFSCNTATNGSVGKGGIGIYLPLLEHPKEAMVVLLLFCVIEFGLYSLLIWKDKRGDRLFYIINVSLLVIPIIRIGAGRDFCMRASIPANLVLMVFVLQYLFKHSKEVCWRWVGLIIALTIAAFSATFDIMQSMKHIIDNEFRPVVADHLYTFSDKWAVDYSEDTDLINFVSPNPEDTIFFNVLSKRKTENEKAHDLDVSKSYREEHNLPIPRGAYSMYPYLDNTTVLTCYKDDIILGEKDSTVSKVIFRSSNDYYQLIFENSNMALDVPFATASSGTILKQFAISSSKAQRWNVISVLDNAYAVLFDGQWAITYDIDSSSVYLDKYTESENQLWKIE